MKEENISKECSDPTQTFTVELPCQLAERIERYARESGTPISGVLVEALDNFLRNAG
ncbi:hypothetical protein [Desulfospira joergensenii]|uniref:hypothetical protein n=1 Tax=Desulfospira joergensenii TaxID=53329 RepID=UPI0003B476B1|nr:hypothetical protein [Desulfospira joergensenii]